MDDLVAWLQAQLDEDERLARECIGEVGAWRKGQPYPDDHYRPETPPEPRELADDDAFPSYPWGACRDRELAFMAGPGHPDHVLADCEAKRAIIDACANMLWQHEGGPDVVADSVLREYGAMYAKLGRPGYQESWRPA